jgi:excisionase family DNA binding protein
MLEMLSAGAKADLLSFIDSRVAEQLEAHAPHAQGSPWFTVKDAADYLRTSQAAIRKRIERKQLACYRPEGSPILLRREELDAAMGWTSKPSGPMLQPPTKQMAPRGCTLRGRDTRR